jgi:MFS family permease
MWPLYAAGFTTAFGAHGIAANLGAGDADLVRSVLYLGVLLALYDGAEVVLKPVFGTVADRVGARPVLFAGLVAFAASSAVFVAVRDPGWLWAARLGQGAAASAFSPAASALVARLNPAARHGRAFGSYGFWKSLGYAGGPLLGSALVWAGGLPLLFAVLTALPLAVAGWVAAAVPSLPPLPRTRQTLLDLTRRLGDGAFLRPGAALAASTAALSVGVGFLPATGRLDRLVFPGTVRVDSGVEEGDEVGIHYDPMLAKLIAHGPTRAAAIERLVRALDATIVEGVATNRGFLGRLLSLSGFRSGDVHTGLLAAHEAALVAPVPEVSWPVAVAAAFDGAPAPAGETGFAAPFRLNLPLVHHGALPSRSPG